MKQKEQIHGVRSAAKRAVCSAVCLTLLCGAMSAAQAQAKTEEQGKDKFALLGIASAISSGIGIFQALTNWASSRIQTLDNVANTAAAVAANPFMLVPPAFAAGQAQPVPYTQAPSYSPAPLIMGQPDVPLAIQQASFDPNRSWDGKANYQGVSVSAVMLDGQNRVIETRSLAAAFRSGERFKLRLVSTSDAIVSLDALRAPPGTVAANGMLNAAPAWVGQLYPPRTDQVVQVKAGDVVYIPLGANEYFTFDNKPGVDLLSLNVRHPQAKNDLVNRQPVYRQDAQGMTTYSQLAQNGTFMALTQVLALQHGQ